jgi:ADP-heptose:LPS heptosyltransferase
LYFSENETNFPEKLKGNRLDPKDKLVGVQLEAGTPAKEWTEEHAETFVGLCAKELPPCKIVFVGTDAKKFPWLSKNVEGNAQFIDLIGKTSLRELLLLLGHFKAFVGPDSGPAHLASSLGVPTLFLYSGTNRFEEWKSLAESASFLRHEVPCAPCGLVRCKVPGHPCMSGIEPAAVIRFIKEKVL